MRLLKLLILAKALGYMQNEMCSMHEIEIMIRLQDAVSRMRRTSHQRSAIYLRKELDIDFGSIRSKPFIERFYNVAFHLISLKNEKFLRGYPIMSARRIKLWMNHGHSQWPKPIVRQRKFIPR